MTRCVVRGNPKAEGSEPVLRVTPETAGWTYIGLDVYRLQPEDSLAISTAGRETAVIVLEGTCHIRVGDERYTGVGGRGSVFDQQPPEAVYVPPGPAVWVSAQGRAEVAVATSVASAGAGGPRRISGADMPYERRGEGTTERYVRHILDEFHPASKLLLVEVVTPPGHWSSFPPHKHDEDAGERETYLEEIYYYRLDPAVGHAWQRVYDKGRLDEWVAAGDGDAVLVPRGYHPVASPPGFCTYYLNVMAGHRREWKYTVDSDYLHVLPKSGTITGSLVDSGAES